MSVLASYVANRRIIVNCGAGGVGKTTASAALALAGARMGRRVLVLTIDPSKRLAETLGVARNEPEPLPLPEERQRAAGIVPPGCLSAWVLHPGLVTERVIRKLTRTEEEARRMLQNRVYRNVSHMVAGIQEYAAVQALHDLVSSGNYDLVVLDTPPSRNALNFLEAPSRLARFLDGRIFKLFLPRSGILTGATTKLIWKIVATVFGEDFFREFQSFLQLFGGIFGTVNVNARALKARLQRSDVAFLLVTAPSREAIKEAFHFEGRIRELNLPFGGFILNRSRVPDSELIFPDESLLPEAGPPHYVSALSKLIALAEEERAGAAHDVAFLARLNERTGGTVPALAVPEIPGGVDDMKSLSKLVDWLLARGFADRRAPA